MLFNNKETNQNISVASAYILWRSLTDRNITVETFNLLKNFVFDDNFKKYIEKLLDEYSVEINEINKLLNKFSLVSSDPPAHDQTFASRKELINDQMIAATLYRFMRLDVNLLMLIMKEMPSNIEVFDFIRKLTEKAVKRVDYLIKLMKKNNWLYLPSKYLHTKPEIKEEVAINEIYILYDHLVYRYNNKRLTEILSVYVSDQTFNVLLTAGVKILESQIKKLEDKLTYFGVVLPKRYSSNTAIPKDKEMFEDRFIFNQILRGMQDAVALHGTSIQEIVMNDHLRHFFIELTLSELDIIDKMIKYGKSQGWTFEIPSY
ncbi:DUF3231 family protein [Dehalobacter sp. TeCB1]|uniref:DUF3231 family protein n=1 Tax=Dehalobacter sp. TeCB1 TaxID=1843715 RepID=UPI00083B00B8|nr:DUF3231 family protein [Dehalobacter sp. TeCB1]OCZ49862.1 hypothetical protein A7D23_00495 [Dehalobacter sp. TeCB1]